MNSVSGEVSQPMRNRGIEISILSSEFTRADAVQVALATGVSLHDTVSLLPDTCDIRRAKFVAETACAMGGAGCSLEETVELIGELHPQQVFRQRDSECLPASGMAVSSLQQPSLHEWLNRPDQAGFLRTCCSVASIAQAINSASESNSQLPSSAIQTAPSQIAAACALALYGSAQDHNAIELVLQSLPPNSFLELVKAGVAHLRDQNFQEFDSIGSFNVLLGYLGICSASIASSKNANSSVCSTSTLCMWFSTVLTIDGLFLQNQGKSLIFTSMCSLFSM